MADAARRAAILFNPIAGGGRAAAIAARAEAHLRDAGWKVQSLATHAAGEAQPLARGCAAEIERLVVAGGDGSVREALAGLSEAGESQRVEVALLPCGNANVVARELGLPLDPEAAIQHLSSRTVAPVDLAHANGELFLAVVGVGWDARTVRLLSQMRATRFGARAYKLLADLVYLVAGLRAVLRGDAGRFTLEVDGTPAPERYCAVISGNLRCYGKGWAMVPEARAASGLLHYQARRREGFLPILRQLLAAWRRRPVPASVSHYGSGRELVVRADAPFPFQVDGDDRGDTSELHLEIDAAGARFVVPEVAEAS